MRMIDNLKDYLMDKEYYIDIYDNKIHLFNYVELLKLRDDNIKVKFDSFEIGITGNKLSIIEMNNQELLIEGIINNMEFIR